MLYEISPRILCIGAPELDTHQSMMAYPNGMDEAESRLDKINAVQPYSEVVDLEPDGHRSNFREHCSTGRGPVSRINGDARAQIDAATASCGGLETQTKKVRSFPVGIAWAARRPTLGNHGLYEAMIVGVGDQGNSYVL